MKGHAPAKSHPWKKYKAVTNKTEADKIYSGYAADGKDYKLPKKRSPKKGITE